MLDLPEVKQEKNNILGKIKSKGLNAPFFVLNMKTDELYKIFLQSTGITTDTRKVAEGNLFFALSGEKFDGNAFADEAIKKGCSYAVVDNAGFVRNEKYLLVDDCLVALQNLAEFHRKKLTIPFIGITGTNGKTTTKELIAKVLSSKYKVINTEGNLNNHIGVPLTLLRVTQKTEIAIIEMGANHPNEIAFLANIAKPTHGIITNIGKAHLEGFGGFEGVKRTKNELYQYLIQHDGTIFVNAENEILNTLLKDQKVKKVFYGKSDESICKGDVLKSDPFLEFNVPGYGTVKTKLAGRYNLENALAAISFGIYFGIPFDMIKTSLETYEPSNQRSQIKQTNSNVLLMDCYNANPSSMEMALENFSKMEYPSKAVILGDMLELGDESEIEHKKIIQLVLSMKLDRIVMVGPIFHEIASASNIICFKDAQGAKQWITENGFKNFLILIKGSRGIKLESVAEVL